MYTTYLGCREGIYREGGRVGIYLGRLGGSLLRGFGLLREAGRLSSQRYPGS